MNDILEVIGRDTKLTFQASTNGGEWAGACPWCGGTDRFRVWPEQGRYWCRSCDESGTTAWYLHKKHNMSYTDAKALVGDDGVYVPRKGTTAPNQDWRDAADWFVLEARSALHKSPEAMQYLLDRGLSKYTIYEAGLGYNPELRYGKADDWGTEKDVPLPAGIVIPWYIGGTLWNVRVRSVDPNTHKDKRYIAVRGGSNSMYNAYAIKRGVPVVLVEGELDAISINQSLRTISKRPLAVGVATGSTMWSRKPRWVGELALAPLVLVAYDTDEAGNEASRYWLERLENSHRLRPLWGDPNQMLQDGVDLKAWVSTMVKHYEPTPTPIQIAPKIEPVHTFSDMEDPFPPAELAS